MLREYPGVVFVVLVGSRVQVGWLNAVGPIAEMVDLFALRDLSSCLDVGDPMSQLLPSVYSLSAVAFPIQAVSPYIGSVPR